jgi:hypothetical protein
MCRGHMRLEGHGGRGLAAKLVAQPRQRGHGFDDEGRQTKLTVERDWRRFRQIGGQLDIAHNQSTRYLTRSDRAAVDDISQQDERA